MMQTFWRCLLTARLVLQSHVIRRPISRARRTVCMLLCPRGRLDLTLGTPLKTPCLCRACARCKVQEVGGRDWESGIESRKTSSNTDLESWETSNNFAYRSSTPESWEKYNNTAGNLEKQAAITPSELRTRSKRTKTENKPERHGQAQSVAKRST